MLNKDTTCDVAIVGAGPGGLMAARRCAELKLKTIVIDKRQEIGVPVRCGEGLSEHWVKLTGLPIDKTWCLQKIDGAVLYAPNGKKLMLPTSDTGYIIERKRFEKLLAQRAIEAGAQLAIKTLVYDVIKEEDAVVGVRCKGPDGDLNVKCKLVIAADGVDSMTAKRAGIDTANPAQEVDSGYEYEMAGLSFENENYIHLYFGKAIAPRGYVWIFPKAHGLANVGIGISGIHNTDGTKTAKHYLDSFISAHPEIFSNASPIEIKGGCIPVGQPLEKPFCSGLIVIGDAAHMVNPIHGGGMGTTMEAGTLAAEFAKKAIDAGDTSEAFLKAYYDEWLEKRGDKMMRILKFRQFFEKLSDDDMNFIADSVPAQSLLEFSTGAKFSIFIKMLAKRPKLAILAARSLM